MIFTLICRLVSTNRLTEQDAHNLLDNALLILERFQTGSSSPEIVEEARRLIEMALENFRSEP
jgi:hypothetical protein